MIWTTSGMRVAMRTDLRWRRSTRSACAILRPSGLLITVTKNMRSRGRLWIWASITIQLADGVGFGYLQHNVALHAAVRDGELVARPSFWQLDQTLRARPCQASRCI